MNRTDILNKVLEYTTKDRNATHGEPEDLFRQIAEVWSAMLGISISSHQVALLMAALKIVRAIQNPTHEDNWIDLAGYAACGAECVPERNEWLEEGHKLCEEMFGKLAEQNKEAEEDSLLSPILDCNWPSNAIPAIHTLIKTTNQAYCKWGVKLDGCESWLSGARLCIAPAGNIPQYHDPWQAWVWVSPKEQIDT